MSGALLHVGHEDLAGLQSFLAGDREAEEMCSPALLADLIRGRMLIRDEFDELAFLAGRYQTSRYSTGSFALTIVTSLGCNFDCPYCFEAKHPSIMNADVQAAVLQVLDDKLPDIARCDAHDVQYGASIISMARCWMSAPAPSCASGGSGWRR